MIEAKLLRKKLKNGLIVDKWDLVTIIEKQQAEIDSLQKNLDVALMIVNEPAKTLTGGDVEYIVKRWINCHPDAKLDEQFAMPLYSVVNLCKAILKKASEK